MNGRRVTPWIGRWIRPALLLSAGAAAVAATVGIATIGATSANAAAPVKAAPPPLPASARRPLAEMPIAARVQVPKGWAWIETAFGAVWVAKIEHGEVLRIDPATNEVVARIRAGSRPSLAMTSGLGSLWVADVVDRTISRIDPATNRLVATVPVGLTKEEEGTFAVGAGSLWVLSNADGTDSGSLLRVDPANGKVLATIRVREQSRAATFAFDAVWVTSAGGGVVSRVDPRSDRVVAEIRVRAQPRFIVAGHGAVWVLSQSDGSLARIDPATNRVVKTIEIGVPGPGGDLAVDERWVWVSANGVPLTQVDPATNTVLRQYAGGEHADTMRAAFGAAWIVDAPGGEIWRVDASRVGKR